MIIEGLVTSTDSMGHLNIAPMGPIVRGDFESIILRPFQPSTTFNNLNETRAGVFHVVDQVDLIARAAIGRIDVTPPTLPAAMGTGRVLSSCCRWFEFVVESVDVTEQRSVMECRIVYRGEQRSFLGINRARNAVIEAAILATRIHLIPASEILAQFAVLSSAVDKTGDEPERTSFRMLLDYVQSASGMGGHTDADC